MNKNKIICILCKNANQETFSFAETLNEEYTIYICIDNNDSVLPKYNETKIKIIRFYNNEPEKNYFMGCVDYCKNRACSRDKALYYFCKININYEYIWFLEDDVFIPNQNTINYIDNLYEKEDLLSSENIIKISRNDSSLDWQHWDKNNNKIDFPWAHSMICAVRVSNKLMKCILEFVNDKKYLLFDELLFNTIALQNNLFVMTPIELSNIVFSFHDIIPDNINESYLYHPIKNLKKHEELRNKIL
jgi:hypothetical protein